MMSNKFGALAHEEEYIADISKGKDKSQQDTAELQKG